MRFLALIAWFTAALAGLYMLAVWLIENDATDQRSASSRLPLSVIATHMTLAVSGLVVWVAYLLLDRPALAWIALGILGAIALVGFTMFARWIPVYRATGAVPEPMPVPVGAGLEPAPPIQVIQEGPPEGNFPLFIVIAHGTFAVTTVVLVLLSALGVGGS
jgi:hypothetical protein